IAAGKYDAVDDESISLFSIQGEGKHEYKAALLMLGHGATTPQIIAAMKKLRRRPANLEELLAFGETYPDVQLEDTVVALGTAHYNKGNIYSALSLHSLDAWRDEPVRRRLYGAAPFPFARFRRDHKEGGWSGAFRFLAIPF
ncbi:MAG TPA: hypothetical protein VD928_02475, partial [Candidatus Paceibacterota bacterium]|nr:hypothetical protein [Candidatus Paceibacterota bacterium]